MSSEVLLTPARKYTLLPYARRLDFQLFAQSLNELWDPFMAEDYLIRIRQAMNKLTAQSWRVGPPRRSLWQGCLGGERVIQEAKERRDKLDEMFAICERRWAEEDAMINMAKEQASEANREEQKDDRSPPSDVSDECKMA